MESLLTDLRYALRTMRKQFGLTAAVVLTLALGIGANGAIFALVDTVLLRALPLPDSQRVMTIRESTDASEGPCVRCVWIRQRPCEMNELNRTRARDRRKPSCRQSFMK